MTRAANFGLDEISSSDAYCRGYADCLEVHTDTLKDLHELIELKEIKIKGMSSAIDYLRERDRKVVRELGYLKSQYDSKVERDVMNKVINLVKSIYE